MDSNIDGCGVNNDTCLIVVMILARVLVMIIFLMVEILGAKMVA